MPREFNTLLRKLRLNRGYGLREFAEMVNESPSNYHGVESGRRPPWRTLEKLRLVADVLALEEGTAEWDAFFVSARNNVPPNMEHLLERPGVLAMLRTVDELRLTEKDLRAAIKYLKEKGRRGRNANKGSL